MYSLRFIFYLCLCICFRIICCQNTTSTIEIDALHSIYLDGNGQYWNWNRTSLSTIWNFNQSNGDYIYDPCRDNWQGIECSNDDNSSSIFHINILKLDHFNVSGTLSPYIGNLTYLSHLNMSINYISGTIPFALNKLTLLEKLDLNFNTLSGKLPNFKSLIYLKMLHLGNNNFTGIIPESIYQMHGLFSLQLNNNRLHGTLSASINKLIQLHSLFLSRNQLTGTLPSTLIGMNISNVFELHNNHFYGQLLSHVLYNISLVVDLSENYFSGKIPENTNPYYQSRTLILSFSVNQLTGTLPISLLNSKSIKQLYVGYNMLSGSLPDIDGQHSSLRDLYFPMAYITGTLPDSFSGVKSLRLIYGFSNKIHGGIPDSWLVLNRLLGLDFYGNFLSGPLNENIGNLDHMIYFYLNNNSLAGTIPASIGKMYKMISINLENNQLSGPLPPNLFSNMSQISSILLQNNQLTGSLAPGLFSPSTNLRLKNILLGNNQITGTIPESLFELPVLLNISLLKNCFHGTLPKNICNNQNIVSIVMDGLSSSEACRSPIFDPLKIFKGFISRESMSGSLPSCIWKLPYLREIHLSGNSLTGNLRYLDDYDFKNQSSQLTDVYLGFNLLTGTIPRSVQEASQFRVLDLSSNLLTGQISYFTNLTFVSANLELINATATVKGLPQRNVVLSKNALSGYIPAAFRDASNVDILETNLFSCSSFDSNGPINDPNYDGYICGSSQYDNALYFAASAMGLFAILIIFCLYKATATKGHFPSCQSLVFIFRYNWFYLRSLDNNYLPEIESQFFFASFLRVISQFRLLILMLVLYSICICLPIYIFLNSYPGYTMYQNIYGWVTSSVYLNGLLPTIFCSLLWFLALIFSSTYLWRSYHDIVSTDSFNLYNQNLKSPHSSNKIDSNLKDPQRDGISPDVPFEENALEGTANDQNSSILEEHSQKITTPIASKDGKKSTLSLSLSNLPESLSIRRLRYVSKAVVLLVFNCTVNMTVNIFYVLSNTNSSSLSTAFDKSLIYVGLSLFKIMWNIGLVKPSISLLRMGSHLSVTVILFMLVFNLLLAPMLAIAFSDPACLQEFFFGIDSVTIDYGAIVCLFISLLYDLRSSQQCAVPNYYTYQISYQPEFIYTYACSSEILSLYIPIYIVLYTILLFIVPSFVLLGCLFPSRWLSPRVLALIPSIMRPQDKGRNLSTVDPYVIYSIQLNLLVYLIMLMTFGLFAPLFALVCMASMLVFLFMWQYVLFRFIYYEDPESVFYHDTGPIDNSSACYSPDNSEKVNISDQAWMVEMGHPKQSTNPLFDPDHYPPSKDEKVQPHKSLIHSQGNNLGSNEVPVDDDSRIDPPSSIEDSTLVANVDRSIFMSPQARSQLVDIASRKTWKITLTSIYMVLLICVLFYSILLNDALN